MHLKHIQFTNVFLSAVLPYWYYCHRYDDDDDDDDDDD